MYVCMYVSTYVCSTCVCMCVRDINFNYAVVFEGAVCFPQTVNHPINL